MINIFMSCVGI